MYMGFWRCLLHFFIILGVKVEKGVESLFQFLSFGHLLCRLFVFSGAGVEQVDYFLDDNYNSLEQVTESLASADLESSNLIVGIDFTKSNEWTGARSFQRRCLHHIGHEQTSYEQAISIIGKTLPSFDEDNLIPVLDSEMRQHMTKKFLVSMMMIDFVMDLKKC
ncbi:negative regulation of response to water deprivation [Trifolium repens]|nr:negative regulation of response to water deprivation [Trifolium repens]